MKRVMLIAALLWLPARLFAAGEFFFRIDRQGHFSVSLAGQTQVNPSNTYRFFDLTPGVHYLSVNDAYSGQVLFSANLAVADQWRKVAVLDYHFRFAVIDEIRVSWQNWYMPGAQWAPPVYPEPVPVVYVPDERTFADMRNHIAAQSFDNRKLEVARSMTRDLYLSADQVAEICRLFSFDNNRLEYAKFAYDYTLDRALYYKVSATFTFASNARALEQYIQGS